MSSSSFSSLLFSSLGFGVGLIWLELGLECFLFSLSVLPSCLGWVGLGWVGLVWFGLTRVFLSPVVPASLLLLA